MVEKSRTVLINAHARWPGMIDIELWTFAFRYIVTKWNDTPRPDLEYWTPYEVYNGVQRVNKAQNHFDDFQVFVGSQTILLPALIGGGRGCVSGLSNLYPKVVNGIFDAAEAGDYEGALKLQREANQLRKLTGAGIPVPFYHSALRYRGVDIGIPKLPMLSKSAEEEAQLAKALDGFKHFE